MALNVENLLNESYEALGADDPVRKHEFIEKWVPEVCNEINELRSKIVLLETRVTDLEGQVDDLGG